MVGKHDEVVAAAGADKEATHVVGVELEYGLYMDIHFFGFVIRESWCRCSGRRCDLGGADALARLLDVALESFYGDRAVIGRVGGVDAWRGSVVAGFEGH